MTPDAYAMAQRALADLKTAIYLALAAGPREGMRNSDLGRVLGIYAGHVGHEGHIPRTLLEFMATEGVVEQDQEKRWKIRRYPTAQTD